MANTAYDIPTHKILSQKPLFVSLILLRILVIALTFAAACLVLTSKQSTVVYGIPVRARYSYSSAYTFFAVANLIACGFSVVSTLFVVFIVQSKAVDHMYHYFIFLHDLIMTVLLMGGCGAATAVGIIAEDGNSHIGWAAICGHFGKFCDRVIASLVLSYIGILVFLIVMAITAYKSRQPIQV